MRTRYLPVAVATVAVLCAAAQTGSAPAAAGARIAAHDLEADVSFLASDALQGRGTPSPGLEAASEFIASQFRRAGLKPAGSNGFFQNADYLSEQPKLDGLELTLETGAEAVHADPATVWIQHAGEVDLRHAPLRFMPLEESEAVEKMTPEDLRGHVLVLDASRSRRGIRRLSARLAELKPALVVALAEGEAPNGAQGELLEASGPEPVPTVVVFDAAFRKAVSAPAKEGLPLTISAHLAAPGVARVRLRNVIGVLEGSDPALRNTYLLVTAHYDHLGALPAGPGDRIFNGANDDASGTASVIEIAGALAALPERPRRSIAFIAFFGEELGMVGSSYYVAHPVFPLAQTIGDLNLEQMGRTDDLTGPHTGMVNVTGFDYTTVTAALLAAAKESGVRVVKDEAGSDSYYSASDNWPFAEAGVPANTVSVTYEFPDYHQPGDEWTKLDYGNMAQVDSAVARAVFRIADDPEAPRWNTDNPKTERFVRAKQQREGAAGATGR